MGRRKPKHQRKDRGGDNHERVAALREAFNAGESFLSTEASDNNRGSFTDAAKLLISTSSITADDFKGKSFENGAFSKAAKGEKLLGISVEKRAIIQAGVDAAKTRLFQGYGVRV